MSNSSAKFLSDAVKCSHNLVISTWTLHELRGLRKLQQVRMILMLAKKKITTITYTQEDLEQAKQQAPDNYQDYLHGVLAMRAKATHLVTRNTKDFGDFSEELEVLPPERL